MKIVRQIIYTLFGLGNYLKLVSRVYIFLVRKGALKKKYPELFYLEKIVKPGYNCLDIGANLGYYSIFLSRLCSPQGKVFAIEPVPLFRQILEKNLERNKCDNVEVLPYALGQKEEIIKMGMPAVNGVIHHGMTKVVDDKSGDFVTYFEAEMKIPDHLFLETENIDFIKCDVEGYEYYVFSNMISTLNKHKPVIQTELSGTENREQVYNLLTGLGYKCYVLIENNLEPVQLSELPAHIADFYFIPKND